MSNTDPSQKAGLHRAALWVKDLVGEIWRGTPTGRQAGEGGSDGVGARLQTAEARIESLTQELHRQEGQGAVEFGRLEAAAIRALDEIIDADQARISKLTTELQAAQEQIRELREHHEVAERRTTGLLSSLAERDARIIQLDRELTSLRRERETYRPEEGHR